MESWYLVALSQTEMNFKFYEQPKRHWWCRILGLSSHCIVELWEETGVGQNISHEFEFVNELSHLFESEDIIASSLSSYSNTLFYHTIASKSLTDI